MKTDRESTIRRSEPDLTLILAISDGQFLNTSDNPYLINFISRSAVIQHDC